MNARPGFGPGMAAAILVLLSGGCRTAPGPDARLAARLAEVSQTAVELPATPHRGPLTYAVAIERASAASEEIALLVSSVDVAAKEKLAAGDTRDPELRLSYGGNESSQDRIQSSLERNALGIPSATGRELGSATDEETGYAVGLRLFPANPWARDHRIAASTAETYAAIAELLSAQWALANTVRRLFVQIHFLEQSLAVNRERVAVYSNAVQITRTRAGQGESTVADIMDNSRRYLEALSDRDKVSRDLDTIRGELAALVALPADTLKPVFDTDILQAPVIDRLDLNQLEHDALENRRDLAELYWRTAAAESSYREARSERMPWFTYLQGSMGASETSGDSTMSATEADSLGLVRRVDQTTTVDDGEQTEWRIDAGINLPLLPGANHTSDLRLSEYRRASLLEAKARGRIKREIRDAVSAVQSLETARKRYQSDTAALTRDMEQMLVRVESEPSLDPMDTARLREQLLESRRMRLEADMEYCLGVIRLEEVLGMRLKAAR